MPPQPPTGTDEDTLDDVEVVTAEPVVDGAQPLVQHADPLAAVAEPAPRGRSLVGGTTGQVVAQAAAVAATGIVAGAATTALLRAARGRKAAKAVPRGRGRRDGVDVLETRTYVVDVHVLGRR